MSLVKFWKWMAPRKELIPCFWCGKDVAFWNVAFQSWDVLPGTATFCSHACATKHWEDSK